MEADAALALYQSLFYDSVKKIALKYIVSDGDSTIRVLLKNTTNNSRGRLNNEIPESSLSADPSHHAKVDNIPIFIVAVAPRSKSLCTKVDVLRVKKICRVHGED